MVPVVAATIGLALGLSGCGDDGGTAPVDAGNDAGTDENQELTVWLMDGSVPQPVIDGVNADLEKDYPDAKVTVEVQQWNGIQDKLTTALAGNNPPDVIEMGNTQNAHFSAAGALLDLTDRKSDLGGDDWSKGMASSGEWDGKTYGVPLLAANRVVIYRTDLFDAAGVTPPESFDDWVTATEKLNAANAADPAFQGLYLPGQSWYVFAGLLWDEGGDLAVPDGDGWKGALDTPEAEAAIARYGELQALSKAPKDADEATPQQFEVFAEGKVAQMIGLPWEMGSAVGANPALEGKVAVFPIPGKEAGSTGSVFLGGSNVGVAAGTDSPELATAWLGLLTGDKAQTELAIASNIVPNRDALVSKLTDETAKVMAGAASNGKVTPVDPRWAAVEAGANPIKDYMTAVLTGTDPKTAGEKASAEITDRMSGAL
jgi:N,N'-diacetylchitobiose transport system substrate-binding protein